MTIADIRRAPLDTPRRPLPRFAPLIALVFAGLLGACSSQRTADGSAERLDYQLVWPEPPNEAKFVFEADLKNESDIRRETDDERLRRLLTGRENAADLPVYRKPAAVAARQGRVYVADPPNRAIVVFDIPRGKIFHMGVREPNNVVAPVSLAIDDEKRLYVLDGSLKRVMVFDALGLFLFAVGQPTELTRPAGVAASPDGSRIFIVDRGSVENNDHKVIAYAPDGRELYRIGPRGSGPGEVNIPVDATVSPDGKLHVLDSGNFRVQTFDKSGKFLYQFGSVGNGLGQFSRPRSISTDRSGNIYVSDASFNNVQMFSPSGELLMWVGSAGTQNLPGRFALIGGIALDETGRLYISDQYHLKLEVYRPASSKSATNAASGPLPQSKQR